MSATGDGRPILRSDAGSFDALRDRCSEATGIDPGAVEKDYWATEVLRHAVLPHAGIVEVVFKGGTSLSKAFRVIERFSEDIDVIVRLEDGLSGSQAKKTLRRLAERVTHELSIECTREKEGRGYLNARYAIPERAAAEFLSRGVKLEMGSRGGPSPNERRTIRSLMSEAADQLDPSSVTELRDLEPFEVTVLAPERTLAEKLAFMHHRAESGAIEELATGARHLYDVAMLLRRPDLRDRLGGGAIADLMTDVDERSAAAGWGFTPRPASGFAASVAFDRAAGHIGEFRRGYDDIARLVWGEFPTFDEALETVHQYRDLL